MAGENAMHSKFIGALRGASLLALTPALAADCLPPKADSWATHAPKQEGLDAAKLKAAIDFAISAEQAYPPELAKVADIRDLRISVPLKYAKEAFNSPIGPLKPHAPANGIMQLVPQHRQENVSGCAGRQRRLHR
jgi:hypothetical protein